jgi:hypothetical protein
VAQPVVGGEWGAAPGMYWLHFHHLWCGTCAETCAVLKRKLNV